MEQSCQQPRIHGAGQALGQRRRGPIHSEADYRAALGDIAALMASDPAPGTPKGDRMDILGTLAQVYEARHFPIDVPDPVEAESQLAIEKLDCS
jgi:antitoxin component HigA of HigAB toxin-antitoxin module